MPTRISVTMTICALAVASTIGCQASIQQFGASVIVNAPNRGAPLPFGPIEGEIRVPVGPPRATLSVELMGSPNARGTVFVLHGVRADKRSSRHWGELLVAAGFRVVLVDLRGHGRSTGDWLSFGVVESRDLVQVLDALEAHHDTAGRIGVIGLSYGAATAIEWAAIDPRVDAVVAVASFASLRDVVPGYVPMFSEGLIAGAVDLAGTTGGFNPDDASPVRAIAHTDAPVLLIHGLDDRRIPAWHSERIFQARREHTELLLVAGADHASIAKDPVIARRAPDWFVRQLNRTDGRSEAFAPVQPAVSR